jgi:hypothetical protein
LTKSFLSVIFKPIFRKKINFHGRKSVEIASHEVALRGRLHPALPVEGATQAPFQRWETFMSNKSMIASLLAVAFVICLSGKIQAQDAQAPQTQVETKPAEATAEAPAVTPPAVPSTTAEKPAEAPAPGETPAPKAVEEKPAPVIKPIRTTDYLTGKTLILGVGLGGTASPGMFSGKITGEYLFDKLFALGLFLQGGISGDNRFLLIMLDGKFRFSIPELPLELKFNALAGGGTLYRRNSGLGFWDWTGHMGVGCEYFILENLSVGPEFIANITSSSFERSFFNFFATVNYYL